ncbi:carboxylate-amine ligase [Schumannella soli]|uniref:Putative glutamate--cysteine ligase 2 n=1 Tax=Schumannella soli TaxID=2590779 RepID=A0A506Y6L1_9MICO|nr:YbdK family carboxylate-amine ligase [Schumannella soli]TPW77513.1 YbdK family carboxylate-amine ligase [Schumannella soli]
MSARSGPRFGIEEEFFLLDRDTGRVVDAGDIGHGVLTRGEAHGEFLRSQIEFSTSICSSLDDARVQLAQHRRAIAARARERGLVLASTGTPFLASSTAEVTADPRYAGIAAAHATLLDDHQVAALHVHVEVPDLEQRVRVANALRDWLPLLRAATANSPLWRGADSGFASWRAILLRRWTTSGCPPVFADADDQRNRTAALVGLGGSRDAATLAWDVRLSPRYPTVELRVADAQLAPADSVALAALTRALVAAADAGADAARDVAGHPTELLEAGSWHSARFGVRGGVVSAVSGSLIPWEAAVEHLRDLLELDSQPGDLIAGWLSGIRLHGTGADRQRAAFAEGGWPAVRDLLESSVAG